MQVRETRGDGESGSGNLLETGVSPAEQVRAAREVVDQGGRVAPAFAR